jgi:hypothetical protein
MTQQLQKRTFRSLQEANEARNEEWDPGGELDGAFTGVEHAGEVGEVIEQIAAQIENALTALNLDVAIERKFNATSEKQGLHVFLDLTTPYDMTK